MSKENIPPNFALDKSKEVIFYLGKRAVETENEMTAWMKDFSSEYKCIVMKIACLFKKLKDDSRE